MPIFIEGERSRQADRVKTLKEHLKRFNGAIQAQDLAFVAADYLLEAAKAEERRVVFLNQDDDGNELPPDEMREKYKVAPHKNLSILYRRKGEKIKKLMAHFVEEVDRAVMKR